MKSIIVCSIFFLVACASAKDQQDIGGVYSSKRLTVWDQALSFPFYKGIAQREFLELKKDFMFEYRSCAQISKGHWRQNGDSLLLYCSERWFIIDSFNHKPEYAGGTKCWAGPTVFRIKKGTLSRVLKMKDGRYLNCLEKK